MTVTRLLVLFFSLMASSLVYGQSKKQKIKSVAEIFIPPNGQYLRDSMFIDVTEISNIHYLEYLYYAKKDSAQSFYLDQLPDTTCWLKGSAPIDSVSKYYIEHYLRYPGYKDFPVVGVSYEQAINYCKWRGNFVTKLIKLRSSEKKYANLAQYELVVEYRLPTIDEWELAASGGLDRTSYPHGLERPLKNKNYTFKIGRKDVCKCLDENNIKYSRSDIIHKVEFNLKDKFYFNVNEKPISCAKSNAFDLVSINNFTRNNLGIYNMIGNVAEMTSTRGTSKGGSSSHTLEESVIEKSIQYNASEAWLGFRCIALVHLKVKPGI